MHGVDGSAHGLAMMTGRDGGGTPALCGLCDGAERAWSRGSSISGFRNARGARALARAWLGLGGSGCTCGVHDDGLRSDANWRCDAMRGEAR